MARWHVRHHEEPPSVSGGLAVLALGLVAGVAAGAYLAHRLGGVSGMSARVRGRVRSGTPGSPGPLDRPSGSSDERTEPPVLDDGYDYEGDEDDASVSDEQLEAAELEAELADEMDDDDLEDSDDMLDDETGERTEADASDADDSGENDSFVSADPGLEDRVLTAFSNDPVLSERPIDIGAVTAATIELTGTVSTDDEYEHATIVARGVPGVETVINRLSIRAQEAAEDLAARRYADGDPRLTEAHWENETVGTGRPRQGTSQDVGRHAGPKLPLETRTLSESEAVRDAADDILPEPPPRPAPPSDHSPNPVPRAPG